ncbi:aspartic peptidase domain-containing protein [Suillus spraguei]|nr:aspartic peptidase domain-containing protein [Suillus spraguei]
MFSATSLLTVLALSITGSPVSVRNSRITLPMTRRSKFSNSTNLVQWDEARAASFMNHSMHGRRADIFLKNDGCSYRISVDIGDPPTTYNLLVDSGSANTWVGANTKYKPTEDSFNTGQRVGQTYGFGFFEGILWTDTFTLSKEFTITEMPIGVASESEGFYGDGILGIGPTGLTLPRLRDSPEEPIPTVTDCLWKQGFISQPLVGMFFQPTPRDTNEHDYGVLSFGEPDPIFYIGRIAYTRITATPVSSRYWGIDQMITYGTTEILHSTAGIVDSGCTFLLIVSDAYDNYKAATGAELDPATGLLTVTPEQYGALQPLDFHIGGETFSLSPNAQVWPRSLNHLVNGVDGVLYLVVKSLNRRFGSGLDFINGYIFLERFYTVLDSRRSLVGFAKTPFTDDTTY